MTHHKYSIGISSIFDTVFWYLPIFLTVLQYWVSPNVPLIYHQTVNFDYLKLGKFKMIFPKTCMSHKLYSNPPGSHKGWRDVPTVEHCGSKKILIQ